MPEPVLDEEKKKEYRQRDSLYKRIFTPYMAGLS